MSDLPERLLIDECRVGILSEVLTSALICPSEYVRADLVPAWRDAPTCPGLWLVRSWWNTEPFELYDGDRLKEIVQADSGLVELNGTAKPRPIYVSPDVRYRWFGPIPADEVSK